MDEKGITPVIGCILLIALTLVIFTALAVFVIDFTVEGMEFSENVSENIRRTLENHSSLYLP